MMRSLTTLFLAAICASPALAFDNCILSEHLGDDVRITTADGERPGNIGMTLAVGSAIETGPNSAAVIQCSDIQVALGAETRFVLEPAVEQPRASLLQGIIGLIGRRLDGAGNHAVETSRLVAAVRSTEWIVVASPNQDSVFVQEGRVTVSASGRGSQDLTAGDGVDLRGDEALIPQQWPPERIAEITSRLPLGWP